MSASTEERVSMGASNDGKVVVRDPPDNRAIWVRPTLRRLAANKAGHTGHCHDEGMNACGTGRHAS
jgi:hypothetical protein